MTPIAVPYRLASYLSDLDLPLPAEITINAHLPEGDRWAAMVPLFDAVARQVATVVGDGGRPAVMSGDGMATLGAVTGLQRSGIDPAIVWVDAHGDLQTIETSTSGDLSGMTLRVLVGYRPELVTTALGLRPVPPDRVTLVDARDLDPPEVEYLNEAPVQRATVDTLNVADLPEGPLYVHLDLDVVDPGELPGLRAAAPGGPSLSAVAATLRDLVETGRVAAVGLACTWHPGAGAGPRVRPHLEGALAHWTKSPSRTRSPSI